MKMWIVFVTIVSLVSNLTLAAKTTTMDTIQKQFNLLNGNEHLWGWYTHYMGSKLRSPTDLSVSNIIESDPNAQKILAFVVQQVLDPQINKYSVSLDLSAARHDKNISSNDPQRIIFQDVARDMLFSPAAIQDAVLWKTSGSVNAYTFSAVHGKLMAVVYQELLDKMTDAEVKAVFAHELGHMFFKHVLNGIVISAIFNATGRILIPDSTENTVGTNKFNKKAYLALAREKTTELLRNSIGASGPNVDIIVQHYADIAENIGFQVSKDIDVNSIKNLVGKIAQASTLDEKTLFNELNVENIDANAILKKKELEAAMVRLTRSGEISADRMAMVTTDLHSFAGSMVKLMGANGSSTENVLKQIEQLMQKVSESKFDLSQFDLNDHPQLGLRVASILSFKETATYKIVSDSFLKAIDISINLSKKVNENMININANKHELNQDNKIYFENSALYNYLEQLNSIVVSEIIKDLKNGNLSSYNKLKKYFSELNTDFKNSNLIKSTREQHLLNRLDKEMKSLEANSLLTAFVKKARTDLAKLAPYDFMTSSENIELEKLAESVRSEINKGKNQVKNKCLYMY